MVVIHRGLPKGSGRSLLGATWNINVWQVWGAKWWRLSSASHCCSRRWVQSGHGSKPESAANDSASWCWPRSFLELLSLAIDHAATSTAPEPKRLACYLHRGLAKFFRSIWCVFSRVVFSSRSILAPCAHAVVTAIFHGNPGSARAATSHFHTVNTLGNIMSFINVPYLAYTYWNPSWCF